MIEKAIVGASTVLVTLDFCLSVSTHLRKGNNLILNYLLCHQRIVLSCDNGHFMGFSGLCIDALVTELFPFDNFSKNMATQTSQGSPASCKEATCGCLLVCQL